MDNGRRPPGLATPARAREKSRAATDTILADPSRGKPQPALRFAKSRSANPAAQYAQPVDSMLFLHWPSRNGHLFRHLPGIPCVRPMPASACSMNAPGIRRINNGRPFAFVERDSPAVFGGGTRLYVYGALRALATFQGSGDETGMAATWFQTPRGGWGDFLGVSDRNARRCIASLEREGRIKRTGSGGWHRAEWFLATSGLELRDVGMPRLRLELAPMATPEWGDGARRVWSALCWYADGASLSCFASRKTLATVAGLDWRNVTRHLGRMERDGWINVEVRPGRSSTFVLFP